LSLMLIKEALETALDTISPSIPTAHENEDFDPAVRANGIPYQEVFFLPAEPENPEIVGGSLTREQGIMQVTLRYPEGDGAGDADIRAELIRSVFKYGAQFSAGGITVNVGRTPHILRSYIDANRYCLPVEIRFWANIP
jgi:hypothetical protein